MFPVLFTPGKHANAKVCSPAVVGLDGYSTIPDRTIAGRLR
jgi:hypothetical protein